MKIYGHAVIGMNLTLKSQNNRDLSYIENLMYYLRIWWLILKEYINASKSKKITIKLLIKLRTTLKLLFRSIEIRLESMKEIV